MFSWFEQRINPFDKTDDKQPPDRLLPFFWHYLRQVWPWFGWIMVVGLIVAIIEISLFAFLGQLVDLMREAKSPATFLSDNFYLLLGMAFITLILRPIFHSLHTVLANQTIVANVTTRVRWQTHRYVLRQSLSYFQNDFAGRISNKIMQTGGALRETALQLVDALWFVVIYTVGALILFAQNDPLLMIPLGLWIAVYALILWRYVPKIKDLSKESSEARSMLTGRIVDSYTNILTVKLFAHTTREDDYAKDAMTEQTSKFHDVLRFISSLEILISIINSFMVVGTTGLAIWLWSNGYITIGAMALATGLVIRINNMSQWVMWVVTGIFENIGTVQEGMETISKPHEVVDQKDAKELKVDEGEIHFDHIKFHYGKDSGVIDGLNLKIKPGQKVGLVGRSGAGKSTLVNVLLRFYDLEGGKITIDGHDISKVTQDSLRANIGMVTQDTSLLHRSITDNIRYGRPDAKELQVIEAARQAQSHDFIQGLEDLKKRKAYEAHVGERGVKLSGGQRQRIAIARVLLKDAPILILDEATSALDSEVENEIQQQLYELMKGKTVIAIAHRLSTIAAMDRLIIMDQGKIIEDGTHDELIQNEGLYAQLWSRQSGGFLLKETAA